MNPVRTSILTGAGVTTAMLAVVFGSYSRERIDVGGSFGSQMASSGPALTDMVASREKVPQVPEGDYFREMVRLLKREYVEPINDDRKLAIGAVKGMVDSLKDPRSVFMDPDEFKVYNDSVKGKYEGIGADLAFSMDVGKGDTASDPSSMDPSGIQSLAIPKLVVVSVTPGGPADQAGVKPGDWVESVQGHWVLSPVLVEQYQHAIEGASAAATKALPPEEAKQRRDAARSIGVKLRAKLKTMIMPLKARDMLTIGTTGKVDVVWHRGTGLLDTPIAKRESRVSLLDEQSGAITLRFADGSAQRLRQALEGKQDVTLDLRDNAVGDYKAMLQCLAVVAPSGDYGQVKSEKAHKSYKVSISGGNPKPPHIRILVDRSTRGPAEIFATALSSRKLAHVSGKASGDRSVVELVSLPDGSGYTLAIGEYKPFPTPDASRRAVLRDGEPAPVAMRDADGTIVAMKASHGGNA